MKEAVKATIRLIVAGVLLVNTILTAKGMNPIPFDETAVTEVFTQIAAGLGCVWVWWKNNNVTQKAQQAQSALEFSRQDGDGSDGAVFGEIEEMEGEK